MKKTAFIILLLAVVAGIYFWLRSRKPSVSVERIDWIGKKVSYRMSVNGERVELELSIEGEVDKQINKTKDGKYTFLAQKFYSVQQIELALLEGTTVVKGYLIDFKKQSQTELTEVTPA